MKKTVLFILCFLFTTSLFAINPVRGLRRLNNAAFKTPLNTTITRQTFAQLHASQQLAQFSKAEQALLLTHKFTMEFNRWPRTVISRDGKLVNPAQYTTEEIQETQLGKLLRRTLENNPQTPPLIREELENLKRAYSVNQKHIFVLEKLNAWLNTHPWPRETIPHEGRPLTEQESYEIALAKDANKILAVPLNAIPRELAEQLRSIRQLTDWDYYPTAQDKQQVVYEQVLNQLYAWLNQYHTWPQAGTNVSFEEWSLSNHIDHILSSPDMEKYPILMELAALKSTYAPLTEISSNIDTPVPTRPTYAYYTPESELGRTPILPTYDRAPNRIYNPPSSIIEEENQAVLLRLIDWLKENHTWPHIYSTTGNKREIQLAKNVQELATHHNRELGSLFKQWQQRPLSFKLATATPASELFEELNRWIIRNNRWPEEQKITFKQNNPIPVPEEEYTPEDVEETNLAKRVAAFVTYAHEFEQGAWKKEPFGKWWNLLSLPFAFENPDLEQFRVLYRQYNDY